MKGRILERVQEETQIRLFLDVLDPWGDGEVGVEYGRREKRKEKIKELV